MSELPPVDGDVLNTMATTAVCMMSRPGLENAVFVMDLPEYRTSTPGSPYMVQVRVEFNIPDSRRRHVLAVYCTAHVDDGEHHNRLYAFSPACRRRFVDEVRLHSFHPCKWTVRPRLQFTLYPRR
jgi:hypothetical protein